MICNKRSARRSKKPGYGLRYGALRDRAAKCAGIAQRLGFGPGILVLIVLAGIVSMGSASCSRNVSTTPTSVASPTPKTGVTLANYERLLNGMSYSEVENTLGTTGKEVSSGDTAGPGTVTYIWGGEGGNMKVTFQNDRLVQKSQYGLQ